MSMPWNILKWYIPQTHHWCPKFPLVGWWKKRDTIETHGFSIIFRYFRWPPFQAPASKEGVGCRMGGYEWYADSQRMPLSCLCMSVHVWFCLVYVYIYIHIHYVYGIHVDKSKYNIN
jgi:hypothetical protein